MSAAQLVAPTSQSSHMYVTTFMAAMGPLLPFAGARLDAAKPSVDRSWPLWVL